MVAEKHSDQDDLTQRRSVNLEQFMQQGMKPSCNIRPSCFRVVGRTSRGHCQAREENTWLSRLQFCFSPKIT